MSEVAALSASTAPVRWPRLLGWKLYLVIAAPTLLVLCLVTGPFQVTDEPNHLYRAIQLSHLQAEPVVLPGAKQAGAMIEKSAEDLGVQFGRYEIDFDTAHRFDFRETLATGQTSNDLSRIFVPFSNTVIYLPIAHALPALTIGLARDFGVEPLVWLYVGRVTNAVAAIAISAFAIFLLGDAALFGLAFCTLPMVLFLEASVSIDALVIPFSLLMSALMTLIIRGETLRWWFYPVLLVAMLYVCAAKFAYMPLAALPPLIAITCHQRRYEIIQISILSVIVTIVWASWSYVVRNDVFTIRPEISEIDVYGQLQYVMHAPLKFVAVLLRTIKESGFAMSKEMIGSRLGWMSLPAPKLLTVAAALNLGLAVAFQPVVTNRRRLAVGITWVLLVLALFAIFFLLYLQNNLIGNSVVEGTQGRYLLPLLAFLPILMPWWRNNRRWGAIAARCNAGLSAIVSITLIGFIWLSYW